MAFLAFCYGAQRRHKALAIIYPSVDSLLNLYGDDVACVPIRWAIFYYRIDFNDHLLTSSVLPFNLLSSCTVVDCAVTVRTMVIGESRRWIRKQLSMNGNGTPKRFLSTFASCTITCRAATEITANYLFERAHKRRQRKQRIQRRQHDSWTTARERERKREQVGGKRTARVNSKIINYRFVVCVRNCGCFGYIVS